MSLKTKNMPFLVAFLLGQGVLHLMVLGESAAAGELAALDWKKSAGALLAAVIVFVLCDFLPDELKAQLVFWRRRNPLPGSFAFSKYMHEDSRIDPDRLEQRHGPLPADAAQQNRLWYSIFKPHRDKPSIAQSHGRFLLLRELTAMSAILVWLLGASAVAFSPMPAARQALYVAFLVMQYAMISQAAANAGVRMVKNALAEECA